MSETLIVGAGLSGLLLAKQLKQRGIPFKGLERELRAGGRIESGHQRLYTGEARDLLNEAFPGMEWVSVEEDPAQIKKGQWAPVTDEVSDPERFYLAKPFFHPKAHYRDLIAQLVAEVGTSFQLRSNITEVDLAAKKVTCLSGLEVTYSRMVWTPSLASLAKVTEHTPRGLTKKKTPLLETGGITWDIRVGQPLFGQANTLVFPFRYKDLKLRALGVRATWAPEHAETYQWMIFLDDALLENHEELAKIVRAFKRDLNKQFPALEGHLLWERIAFHTSLSGEFPVPAASLEVFEGVACLGSDIQTEEVSPEEHHPRRNLDVTLRNLLDFQDLILPRWLEAQVQPNTAAEAAPETDAPFSA